MQEFLIKSISDLEKLSHAAKWQYFEKLVAFVFEENEYHVDQGVVIKVANGKRQIDVLARKFDKVFLVECKKWKNKERTSALNSAVKKHLERCDFYSVTKNRTATPIIVTLLDDDIEEKEGVAIVPIMKLNWFLNNLD
jgi:predicted AAA+ superfamily ATPase